MRSTIEHQGKTLQICSRCIFDETVRNISFDEEGVCNYCHTMDEYAEQYKTGTPEGEKMLFEILHNIKREGKGKKYDCVVGFSGGTDSSYLLDKLIEWEIRPLAVNYSNGWDTKIAGENMQKILEALNIDLFQYKVDLPEVNDLILAFMRAAVPEIDAPTDLALPETLYRAADKYNLKYVMDGHSYTTEGIAPMSSMYFDGMYIKDIHNKFGALPLKTYPLLQFNDQMKWALVKRIQRIRPLWYINYAKGDAQKSLNEKFSWEYYGGHHLENKITAFMHTIWFPKFGIDLRNSSLAAAVRSGIMSREDAITEYFYTPIKVDEALVNEVKQRLRLSDEEFQALLDQPNKSYKDYKTYKKRFERLRPLFYIMAKSNLIPMSFYTKYTAKENK